MYLKRCTADISIIGETGPDIWVQTSGSRFVGVGERAVFFGLCGAKSALSRDNWGRDNWDDIF